MAGYLLFILTGRTTIMAGPRGTSEALNSQNVSLPIGTDIPFENIVPKDVPQQNDQPVVQKGPRADQVLGKLTQATGLAGVGRFVDPVVAKFDKFLDKVVAFSGNLDVRGSAIKPTEEFLREVYS
jgi:hypothetical protein